MNSAIAYENETVSVISARATHAMQNDMFSMFTLHKRFVEGFKETEREIFEARFGKNSGNRQLTAAYNLHFDRLTADGEEHRLWQQYRYTLPRLNHELDFRIRLEERYFTASDDVGARARLVLYWNKPLSARNELRLGNELVLNLNDYGISAQKGFSQDRLLASFIHELENGNRLDFNYQYRYIHQNNAENFIQHQIQMMLTFNL